MKHNRNQGFTLVEILFVIGLMGFIGLAIISFERNMIASSRLLREQLETQQQIRRLFKEFEGEMRTMAPSQAGAYPIAEATSSSITFFSDYDKDGVRERIRYFYATSTKSIRKGVIEPSGAGTTTYTLANEVFSDRVINLDTSATTTPIFQYYNSSYDGVATNTPLTSPINIPDVRHIKMLIYVRVPSQKGSTTPLMFQTQVTPRNIKDNL